MAIDNPSGKNIRDKFKAGKSNVGEKGLHATLDKLEEKNDKLKNFRKGLFMICELLNNLHTGLNLEENDPHKLMHYLGFKEENLMKVLEHLFKDLTHAEILAIVQNEELNGGEMTLRLLRFDGKTKAEDMKVRLDRFILDMEQLEGLMESGMVTQAINTVILLCALENPADLPEDSPLHQIRSRLELAQKCGLPVQTKGYETVPQRRIIIKQAGPESSRAAGDARAFFDDLRSALKSNTCKPGLQDEVAEAAREVGVKGGIASALADGTPESALAIVARFYNLPGEPEAVAMMDKIHKQWLKNDAEKRKVQAGQKYLEGDIARKAGDAGKALQHYHDATTIDPTFAEAYYGMAILQVPDTTVAGIPGSAKRQAADSLKKFVALWSDATDLVADAIQRLHDLGKLDEAIQEKLDACRKAFVAGDIERAGNLADQGEEMAPGNADFILAQAFCLKADGTGRHAEAADHFDAAARLPGVTDETLQKAGKKLSVIAPLKLVHLVDELLTEAESEMAAAAPDLAKATRLLEKSIVLEANVSVKARFEALRDQVRTARPTLAESQGKQAWDGVKAARKETGAAKKTKLLNSASLHLKVARVLDPGNIRLDYVMAVGHRQRGNKRQAVAVATRILTERTDNAEVLDWTRQMMEELEPGSLERLHAAEMRLGADALTGNFLDKARGHFRIASQIKNNDPSPLSATTEMLLDRITRIRDLDPAEQADWQAARTAMEARFPKILENLLDVPLDKAREINKTANRRGGWLDAVERDNSFDLTDSVLRLNGKHFRARNLQAYAFYLDGNKTQAKTVYTGVLTEMDALRASRGAAGLNEREKIVFEHAYDMLDFLLKEDSTTVAAKLGINR